MEFAVEHITKIMKRIRNEISLIVQVPLTVFRPIEVTHVKVKCDGKVKLWHIGKHEIRMVMCAGMTSVSH